MRGRQQSTKAPAGGRTDDDAIAIVGAGCRFPGGISGPDDFWRALTSGTDVITEVPPTRWDVDRYYSPDAGTTGRMYSRWGGFIEGETRFDTAFFGISPRESRQIDPQHRMMLEVAWEALENAGLVPEELAGSRTAVYVGGLGMDYTLLHSRQAGMGGIDPWYALGKEPSFHSGRLSYLLQFHGPSLSLSTACSSSLVAVHLARQSLLAGECDAALAGGVNLLLSPDLNVFMCQIGAMSKDGRCKTFDASADGIVRGDGAVVLVLKRLSDALAEGDDVIAVIRGSAVNHDGASAGLTAPNGAAQQALLRQALAVAGLEPRQVGYVEAHGTGTPLGDPIEMSALASVLGEGRSGHDPLLVGSVKTNFGHTDGAAGAAGLLKAALSVRHGQIPPHLHLRNPSPAIPWDRWPVRVPVELTDFPGDPRHRVAGASAFGLSGTNAHVVVESPPQPEPARAGREEDPFREGGSFLLPVSARSGEALRQLAAQHRDRLRGPAAGTDAEVAAYVHTAAVRRSHHARHRLAVTGRTTGELAAGLTSFLEDEPAPGVAHGGRDDPDSPVPGVCFLFSGQGSQWPGMGRELLAREAAFGAALRECDDVVRELAGWSVIDELLRDEPDSRLADTEIAQPVIFSVQAAAAVLWRSWGIVPTAVVGHSMGEIAAAHVAGALTLPDAARVIVHRGRLLAPSAGQGLMAAVALGEADVVGLLEPYGDRLALAAVNSPGSVVVSGVPAAVEEFREELDRRGVTTRLLPGTHPFHSPQMADHASQLAAELAGLPWRTPGIPVLTTTGNTPPGPVPFDAEQWGRNVRQPVRFAEAIAEAIDSGHRLFVELGPHPVLAQPVTQCLRAAGVEGAVVPTLRRDTDDVLTAKGALATLYTHGVPPDWTSASGGAGRSRALPTYPWQGEPLWFERADGATEAATEADTVPAAGLPQATGLRGELRLYDAEGRLVAETEPLRLLTPGTANSEPPATIPAPAAPATDGATTGLTDTVAAAVAGVLGLGSGAVRRREGFASLGMDSLGSVELARSLERSLGVALPRTVAFDHPSVERLAAHLSTLVPGAHDRASTPVRPRATAATTGPEPIAVIGVGCRLPGGVRGPEDYWRLLTEGIDAVGPAPEDRLAGPEVWRGGFLADDVAGFDASFFRISPVEARAMDPQQRFFLEVAWEALEHAGTPARDLAGTRTGVFLGMNSYDYGQLITHHPDNLDIYYGIGNSFSAAAGRLSYLLGLNGPSLAVDTACSSSLVAVHLAVRSLRSGESDMAVAAGVNLVLSSTIHRVSAAGGALAPDGRCKTFDASADGYSRGEGCGAVILKPLSRAEADGDEVMAVILGSAINQDGASSGLTVPNGPAQEALIRAALADGRVAADEVGYVEAHGTGTPLGDPIELRALGAVLGRRDGADNCLVGSVKTNLGHLEAASGIAGLIKTVLALRHRAIPRHLHFREPNPDIPWQELPLRVPTELVPWTSRGPRTAGVSAFGFSGTNAHVVLAEAPRPRGQGDADSAPAVPAFVLPLSAATATALPDQARAYHAALATGTGIAEEDLSGAEDRPAGDGLARLCATAALRRSHLDHRLVVVGRDRHELADRLAAFADDPGGRHGPGIVVGRADRDRARGPVFVFSGHGSHWAGMAQDLASNDPVCRAALSRCDQALAPHIDWSVREVLESGREPALESDQQILVFALQYALSEMWRTAGVTPGAVVGHSMGEVSAALCAGALTLEQAAEIMVRRSELLKQLANQGGMAVVGMDATRTEEAIRGYGEQLSVAVINSRSSTVVAGTHEALADFGARMKESKVFFKAVRAGGPGHSALVEPLRHQLESELAGLTPAAPRLLMYSTADSRPVEGATLDAAYWGRNMRLPVRFADAVRHLVAEGYDTFVELSPHPLQLAPVEQELSAAGVEGLLVPSLLRKTDSRLALLSAFGTLHAGGQLVDWRWLYPATVRPTATPPYVWQHKRYWMRNTAAPASSGTPLRWAGGPGHPLIAQDVRLLGPGAARVLQAAIPPELAASCGSQPVAPGHQAVRLPGALWLEMALAAADEGSGGGPVTLENVELSHAPVVEPGTTSLAQLSLTPAADGTSAFTVRATAGAAAEPDHDERPGGDRKTATGRIRPAAAQGTVDGDRPGPSADRARGEVPAAVQDWFRAFQGSGVAPVPESAWSAPGQGTGNAPEFVIAVRCRPAALRWHLPPELLDLALRLPVLAGAPDAAGWVPRHLRSLTVYGAPGERVRIGARVTRDDQHGMLADVWITDETGHPVADARGVRLAPPPGRVLAEEERDRVADRLYHTAWRERSLAPSPPGSDGTDPQDVRAAHPRDGELLVLADRTGVAATLARRLDERGLPYRLLPATGTDGPVADDARRAEAAWRDLAKGPGCRAVIHLWPLDLPTGTPGEREADAAARVCAGMHPLAAAGTSPVWHVTRGAVAVDATDRPAPLHAAVRQTATVIGVRRPGAWGGTLDLDPVRPGADAGTGTDDADAILAEVLSGDGEDHVALRGGTRLVARVTRGTAPPPVLDPVRLDAGRTYLVAGAEHRLAVHVRDWLCARGAREVLMVSARADAAHVRDVLDKAADSGRPVAGLVWLGAEWEPWSGGEPDAEALSRALHDRARGAWVWHEACADAGAELDLFVAFGSAASHWGALGAEVQAPVDGMLTALAGRRRALGRPVTAIAWTPWDGLDLLSADARARLVRGGLEPLDPAAATELLDASVDLGFHDVLAASADWSLLLPLYRQTMRWPLFDEMDASASPARAGDGELVAHLSTLSPTARAERLLECVLDEVIVVLGMDGGDEPDTRQGFFEMGVNSVTALELKVRLERRLGVPLPATLVFEYPTCEAVADYLAAGLPGGQERPAAPEPAPGRAPEPAAAPPAATTAPDDEDLLARLARETEAVEALIRQRP
ncbi:beta-ketoacyl synthase N-terminal-like domain-containing protein [Streptomyces sp. B8F3]|uniref:type I polyketide synthase n=1 Tax=Streptomyces sp. B8F3 TaxID=3153573 RepID=UPI00325C5F6D